MTRWWRQPAITAGMICLFVATGFGDSEDTFRAKLSGFNEVPPINTNGTGTFKATFDEHTGQLNYTITFSGLGSNVTQSHVHFAEPGVSGGVMFFLCTNLGNGPAGTPACPATGGTVTGTITSASIVAINAQNLTATDLTSVLKIMRNGVGYANVHTTVFPAGEIRGQVKGDD